MKLLENRKNTLYTTFVDIGFVEHFTKINNDILKKSFLKDYKNKKDNLAAINDLEVNRIIDISWVIEYIRDYHKASGKKQFERNRTLSPSKIFLNVEEQNEMSVLRNHFDYNNSIQSPKMTVLYFVTGGGELYIKHKNLNREEDWSFIDIKEKMYVVFNSELNYLRTPNPNKEPRITITWPCLYL